MINNLKNIHTLAFEGDLFSFKAKVDDDRQQLCLRDGDDRLPLHWAVSGKRNDIVEYILQTTEGAQLVDEPDSAHWSPLLIAASTGNAEAAAMLLGKGARVTHSNENGQVALHYAASKNFLDLAKTVLVPAMESVDVVDRAGQTPLHRAAGKGNTAFCQFLIDKNASVSARDKLGNTPLHVACEEGHGDIVILLIESGADPSLENNEKKTSIALADKKLLPYLKEYL